MNTDELLQQNLEREAAKAAINTLQSELKRANKAIEKSITTFVALRERNEQLERELAEAQNLNNLMRESHDVVTKQFQKVDAELAETRQQRNKWAYECGENMKLLKETIATATRAIIQRDTLAEALQEYREALSNGPENCSYARYGYVDEKAKQALAAVKGEKP